MYDQSGPALRAATPQKDTAFAEIERAAIRLSDTDERIAKLADRLCGPVLSDTAKGNVAQLPSAGLFGQLHEMGSGMQARLGRINEALDAIESRLP